jgi:hypothetical protein
LAEVLNRNFGPPFLKKGSVVAQVEKEGKKLTLTLTIGRRDITIDVKGDVIGAGTTLV